MTFTQAPAVCEKNIFHYYFCCTQPVENYPSHLLDWTYSSYEEVTGLEINFFAQETAGDWGKKFGRQVIYFSRQHI